MAVNQPAFAHVALGVRIEAVPYLADKRTDGAVFLFGDLPTWESSTGFYPILESLPPSITGSVDPSSCKLELSALSFSICATDTALQLLMTHPNPRIRVGSEVSGSYTGNIAESATEIVVTTGQTIAAGDYLWIGDECLYVDAATNVAEEWTLTVTRGVASSPDSSHAAGTFVHASCPIGQLEPVVTLELYDFADSSTTVLWSGLLDGQITTDDDQNSLILNASELLQRLVDLELAATPQSFESSNVRVGTNGGIAGTIRPVDLDAEQWVNPNQSEKILRVGDDHMGPWLWDGSTLTPAGSHIFGQSLQEGEPGDPIDGTIREVLAVNRLSRNGIAHNSFLGIDGGLHFAAVALSLLLSTGTGDNDPAFGTFDVLGKQWGAGLPVRLIDEASWEALITEDADQIDQLLLGYDGTFDPWETVRDLLVGHQCFLAINNAGKLAIHRQESLKPETVGEIMTAYHWSVLMPQRIRMERADTRPNVRAEIGGLDAPNNDADVVTVAPIWGTRRDSTTYGQSPASYSMPWRYPGSLGRDKAQDFLSTAAKRRADNVPTLTCSIPYRHFSQQFQAGDYTARTMPSLGEWIRLRAPAELSDGASDLRVIGPDGERLDINDTAITFIGRLIGVSLDLTNGAVEAKVELSNWTRGDTFSRLVAPCHLITDWNEDLTFPVATLSTQHFSAAGQSEFVTGDQVEIILQSGKRWLGSDELMTVTSVDDVGPVFGVTLEADDTLLETFPTTYPIYLRLADADTYDNDGWPGSEWFTGSAAARRWAYVAGTDLEIGTVLQDDPDKWSE